MTNFIAYQTNDKKICNRVIWLHTKSKNFLSAIIVSFKIQIKNGNIPLWN